MKCKHCGSLKHNTDACPIVIVFVDELPRVLGGAQSSNQIMTFRPSTKDDTAEEEEADEPST